MIPARPKLRDPGDANAGGDLRQTMREVGRCSGYMPLSGAVSGRPLVINSVSRRGHLQVLLATFSRPNTAFPQLMSPFKRHARDLRLGEHGGCRAQ